MHWLVAGGKPHKSWAALFKGAGTVLLLSAFLYYNVSYQDAKDAADQAEQELKEGRQKLRGWEAAKRSSLKGLRGEDADFRLQINSAAFDLLSAYRSACVTTPTFCESVPPMRSEDVLLFVRGQQSARVIEETNRAARQLSLILDEHGQIWAGRGKDAIQYRLIFIFVYVLGMLAVVIGYIHEWRGVAE
ncbi:MAG: hypothetical protein V4864_07865 [Pseudomonadota bacterium]